VRLPNCERAFVDLKKLREYCLNPEHPRGRHKARIFAETLGFTAYDAEELRQALLEAACTNEAVLVGDDDFGPRYAVDFRIEGRAGIATVRSLWIVRRDEDFPRLISCYVL
jgi:hypothetical protein